MNQDNDTRFPWFDSVRNPTYSRRFAPRTLLAFVLALLAALAAQTGCAPAGGSPTKITNRSADASAQWSADLFGFALENLNHLEDNDCAEMLQSTRQRLNALAQPKPPAGMLPPDALLASWPEPDMLRQVVSRLNQWVDTQEKPGAPKLDPMLATLPADLLKLPMVKNLAQAHFTAYDGYMLMEAVWLRDASRSKWAGGESADELQVARNLFDWTVRNIQTDYDKPDRVPQVPWETLFLGHGTTWERAWTYILLLRQRGIDAVLLALPTEKSSGAAKPGEEPLRPWCVGVLIGDTKDGKVVKNLYLFDPKLCLPIPGPDGITADKAGRLDVQPATLDQITKNPKLLDRLALGSDAPYWAQKADLKRVVAWVEASPIYCSPRAKRIEARLTGNQKLVLNAEPSQQGDHLKAVGLSDARLWNLPYTTLQRRLASDPDVVSQRLIAYVPFMTGPGSPLYKGRIMHLKGKLFEEKEAVAYYQRARPRTQSVFENIPRTATEYFETMSEKAEKARNGKLTPKENNELKQVAALWAQQAAAAYIQGKLDASYWLGLIQYDQGEYTAALDYFGVRTLQLSLQLDPQGIGGLQRLWAYGAHYNIARTLEAIGQPQKAINVYESIDLRNDDGNLIRARWLKELEVAKNKKPEEKKAEEKKAEEKKPDAGKK